MFKSSSNFRRCELWNSASGPPADSMILIELLARYRRGNESGRIEGSRKMIGKQPSHELERPGGRDCESVKECKDIEGYRTETIGTD